MTNKMPSDDNSTSAMPLPYDEAYWVVCESILVILTFVSFYISVCLLVHAKAKETDRGNQNLCQKIWLKWLCFFGSVTLFLRLCSDHVVAFYGWQNDAACFATVTVSIVLFTISLYTIYAFLWVRQSIFYTNPIIRKSIPVWIIRLSWFTLMSMAATGVTLGVLYHISDVTHWEYNATNGSGCTDVSGHNSTETITYVNVACYASFQVILLVLFIYPLLSREMKKILAPDRSTSAANTYQSSWMSNSGPGENKEQSNDNNDVFHDSPPTETTANKSLPTSPLALEFPAQPEKERTPHVSDETDTGVESEADMSEVERLKLVRPGSVSYRKAKSNSISFKNTISPVASDTESRPRKTTILPRTFRKDNKKGRQLIGMMKHCALLTAICIFTDILVAVIQIPENKDDDDNNKIPRTPPELIYLVIYDINLMINLLCIVLTFREWRSILMPFLTKEKGGNRTISESTLKRKPTPLRRMRKPDRVQELRNEGKRTRRGSSGHYSSGSGDESGDSAHSHIYRPANEALIKTKR